MATKKKKTQIAERLRTMEGFHRGDIDNLTTRDGQRSNLPDGKPIALPELGAGGEEPGKRVIADTRDNAQGLAATGEGEGPTVRAPRTALDDPRSRVEAGLFDVAGVDALEAGGFAKRDEVRAALRRGTTEERKIKRATNLAYREALRRGDRAGALNIRKQARGEGITFGGVSGAGDIERGVAQGIGEKLRTRNELTGGGPASQAPTPAAPAAASVDQGEVDLGGGLIEQQSVQPRKGAVGLFGKKDTSGPSVVSSSDSAAPTASEEPAVAERLGEPAFGDSATELEAAPAQINIDAAPKQIAQVTDKMVEQSKEISKRLREINAPKPKTSKGESFEDRRGDEEFRLKEMQDRVAYQMRRKIDEYDRQVAEDPFPEDPQKKKMWDKLRKQYYPDGE